MSVAIGIQQIAPVAVVAPESLAVTHPKDVSNAQLGPKTRSPSTTTPRTQTYPSTTAPRMRINSDEIRARVVAHLDRGGAPDLNQMAHSAGLSNRTLQRILATSGTTFSMLLDEARYCRARELLAAPVCRVEDIGRRLGFADSVAFRRAFRRWTGTTPGAFRQACVLSSEAEVDTETEEKDR